MRGTVVAKRMAGLSAGLGLIAMLGACGGSSSVDSDTSTRGTMLGNLLAFNSPSSPSPAQPPSQDALLACPDIQVLDGTASSRVYGAGEQTNTNVRYQFSLGEAVRECGHAGDQLTLKVGAEGRALLGPVGAPGSFSAPVRIAVRRIKDETVVYSKLYTLPVTIGASEAQKDFAIVSDPIAVPYISGRTNDDYEILVGFDTKGDGKIGGDATVKKRRRG